MARKSKTALESEQRAAEQLADYQRTYQTRLFKVVEFSKSLLYLDAKIVNGQVEIEGEDALPYEIPKHRGDAWILDDLERRIAEAIEQSQKAEEDRKARELVLAKLSEEERRVLGFK